MKNHRHWFPSFESQVENHKGNPFWDSVVQIGQEMRLRKGDLENAISGAATAQEAKNIKKRLARRIIQEGYPKITSFETKEQVDRYIKGSPNGHTCLICGNSYRALGIHLANLHKIDLNEYRDHYHLPRTFKLACEETREIHRALFLGYIEDGLIEKKDQKEQARIARQAKTKSSESDYKRLSTRSRMSFSREGVSTDVVCWQILHAMRKENLTLSEIFSRPNMPNVSTFRKWKKRDPVRQQAFVDICEGLPFAKQAEMHVLGDRFVLAVLQMRADGRSIDEISAALKVDRISINNRLRLHDPNHMPKKYRGKS